MKQTKDQGRSGPRRLPTAQQDGNEYFVDIRLRQFRTVTPPVGPIEFIDFDSPRGRRMLNECVMLECPGCGQTTIVSRHSSDGDVKCTKCGNGLSLP